jgi:hypothetical protein
VSPNDKDTCEKEGGKWERVFDEPMKKSKGGKLESWTNF